MKKYKTSKKHRAGINRYQTSEHGLAVLTKYRNSIAYKTSKKLYAIKYFAMLRKKVLKFLGNKCCKCNFSDYRALQVDHIRGGGKKETRKIGHAKLYSQILHGKAGYQLLCANCNWIKRYINEEV